MSEFAEFKTTPMMKQYLEAKKEIPKDCILLFRMGDFYEIFFEDAVKAAPLLEVALTKRAGAPMCGVPYHALETYLPRLIDAGVKVAIAEQMEDPKFAKGIVKRAVTRIVTPGTVMEGSTLSPKQNNFLAAISFAEQKFGLAYLDISTGEFKVAELEKIEDVEDEIRRFNPSECLLPQSLAERITEQRLKQFSQKTFWSKLDDWLFSLDSTEHFLKQHFKTASLDGFGCKNMPAAISAAGAVLQYASDNLRQNASHVRKLSIYHPGDFLIIDPHTLRNLELLDSISGDKNSTLLSILDHSATPMGSRLLRNWIGKPLKNIDRIQERLSAVEAIKNDPVGAAELSEILSASRDIQRICAKINIGSVNPREVLSLAQSLEIIPELKKILDCFECPVTGKLKNSLFEFNELVEEIKRAILDSPPAITADGGFIRGGYNEELDTLRKASTEAKNWIAQIQAREQQSTGIKSLKIKFNNVFGYYIEISKSNLHLVPPHYIRKQTIAGGERFITPELKELENKIIGADEKAKALEIELFAQLREKILSCIDKILSTAETIAEIDALNSLAKAGAKYNYTKPVITKEKKIHIKEGRHPVLDARMISERFVPNDTLLDDVENQIIIITGPNMAGKSTYIRQVALITIMAQIGSFVPATYAEIGVMDRIFTRVGASDDISRGQSTFMVEMTETANIINNATERSLVVLDEIGRGTSTFDGISIAWAVAEYLHDSKIRPLTLFATHYHELTELALTCKRVKNFNVAVKEYQDHIIFLRKILPGATDKSYGVHVAKIAGLPSELIERAYEILENLEKNAVTETGKPTLATRTKTKKTSSFEDDQPTLFSWQE